MIICFEDILIIIKLFLIYCIVDKTFKTSKIYARSASKRIVLQNIWNILLLYTFENTSIIIFLKRLEAMESRIDELREWMHNYLDLEDSYALSLAKDSLSAAMEEYRKAGGTRIWPQIRYRKAGGKKIWP